MNIKKVTALYFSPTDSSKKYVQELAMRLSENFEEIDITEMDNRAKSYNFTSDELVIFGSPVYYGRLPMIEGGLFERVHGSGTPAIFTVTYGNREYEDALLEEKTICENNGFKGVAAAALVAQHTYSEKIATGRPNNQDIATLDGFAKSIKLALENDTFLNKKLEVKGNFPYRDVSKSPFVPTASEDCNECGICVSVCPTGAIVESDIKNSDKSKCLACFACVKNCPSSARDIDSLIFKAVIFRLKSKISKVNKANEFFY